jgi:hypothetical protein
VCSDPSSAPPPHFTCGDREQPLNSMPGGHNALDSALNFANLQQQQQSRGSSGGGLSTNVGSYLYLDLMRRALTDYLMSDLTREAETNVLQNTKDLASGWCFSPRFCLFSSLSLFFFHFE